VPIVARLRSTSPLPWAIGIGLLALVVRLPLLGGATAWVDSPLYERIAGSLIRGDGFSSRGHLFGDDYRMPGYPLLVAGFRVLPGTTAEVTGTMQHLIGVAFAVAVLLVAWRFFGRLVGVLAGLLMAIAPLELFTEHALLPDFLFTVLVFTAVALTAEAATREAPSWKLLAGVGLTLAAATYVKPNALILVALAPVAFLLARRGWRLALRATLVCGAALAVALVPWAARNWIEEGTPTLTTQGGASLWVAAFDQDHLPFTAPHGEHERLALAAAERARAFKAAHGLPPLTYAQVFEALRDRGQSAVSAADTMGAMAVRSMLNHPLDYLNGSAHVLKMEWRMTGLSEWPAHRMRGVLDDPPGIGSVWITRAAANVSDVVLTVWWLLTLGGLSGVALLASTERRERAAAGAFLGAWALMAFGTALTNTIDLRYVAQLAPLVWTVGIAGSAFAVRTVIAGLRARRRPAATEPA
jgi:4-amino-4-deoxy-L-arabinose transferase-like glycosyltransferase